MDSKFTVSITDVTGSKHYEVRRMTKRALIIAIAILPILIPRLVSAIHRLNQNVHRLEFKNNRIMNAIAGRHPFQSEESQGLGENITANIRHIFGKVESIEEAMSINTSFEMNLSEWTISV